MLLLGPLTGGGGGGSQCHVSILKKELSCHPVEFKKFPCPMSLSFICYYRRYVACEKQIQMMEIT